MRKESYIGGIAARTGVQKWLVALLSLAILANLFLAVKVSLTTDKTRQTIVPPTITQTFWVDDGGASKEYFNQMALYVAQLNYNVTPFNVNYQHSQLLKYLSPSIYGAAEKELRSTENYLKSNNMSTWIAPRFIGTDENSKVTIVEGEFVAAQGDKIVQRENKTLEIKFSFESGMVSIISMRDITNQSTNQDPNAKANESTEASQKPSTESK